MAGVSSSSVQERQGANAEHPVEGTSIMRGLEHPL